MKPPYDITPTVLKSVTSISEKIGAINANYLNKPSPELRKENKIKTIHSSLKIEGNTLSEEIKIKPGTNYNPGTTISNLQFINPSLRV